MGNCEVGVTTASRAALQHVGMQRHALMRPDPLVARRIAQQLRQLGLCGLHPILDAARVVGGQLVDLGRGRQHGAALGALDDRVGVPAQIGRAGHKLRVGVQLRQPDAAAAIGQTVRHRHHVEALAGAGLRSDLGEDQRVGLAGEVRRRQPVADAVKPAVVQQQPADQAVLGLDAGQRVCLECVAHHAWPPVFSITCRRPLSDSKNSRSQRQFS